MPIGLRGAKRRGAPTEQEMVSLVDKPDTKKHIKPKKTFSALNKRSGSFDELKVSLLDGDNKSAGSHSKPKRGGKLAWDRKRIIRYAALGLGAFIVSYMFLNRQRDINWSNFSKSLHPTATGDKKCFVRYHVHDSLCQNLNL